MYHAPRMQLMIVTAFLLTLYNTVLTDATICEPLSRFRIDCNKCLCSRDGTQYSCTKTICPGQRPPKYIFDDRDYIIPRRGKVPYVDDGLSAEDAENGYQNDIPKHVDWDDNEANRIDDDDNDDGSRYGADYDAKAFDNVIDIDGDIPDNYEHKRAILT